MDIEEENKEDDFDFDFSIYDSDDEEEKSLESINKLERPQVTGLRSRFSNGESELDKLAQLGVLISKYSIDVESRTKDINILWKYYGIISEFWENIRNIFGSVINTEIDELKKVCFDKLEKSKDSIEKGVHSDLLKLRSSIYRLKQLSNLGIETERSMRGIYSKAKRGVIQ